MNDPSIRRTVLMAEDDQDDRLLVEEAFHELEIERDLLFVDDGEQLLDYLHQRNEFADEMKFPRPDLIFLDLNMPRTDGREALREIKLNPSTHSIPVIVFTTSSSRDDILRCYELGCNSYLSKPASFDGLTKVIKLLDDYWLGTVELPSA